MDIQQRWNSYKFLFSINYTNLKGILILLHTKFKVALKNVEPVTTFLKLWVSAIANMLVSKNLIRKSQGRVLKTVIQLLWFLFKWNVIKCSQRNWHYCYKTMKHTYFFRWRNENFSTNRMSIAFAKKCLHLKSLQTKQMQ